MYSSMICLTLIRSDPRFTILYTCTILYLSDSSAFSYLHHSHATHLSLGHHYTFRHVLISETSNSRLIFHITGAHKFFFCTYYWTLKKCILYFFLTRYHTYVCRKHFKKFFICTLLSSFLIKANKYYTFKFNITQKTIYVHVLKLFVISTFDCEQGFPNSHALTKSSKLKINRSGNGKRRTTGGIKGRFHFLNLHTRLGIVEGNCYVAVCSQHAKSLRVVDCF